MCSLNIINNVIYIYDLKLLSVILFIYNEYII